MSDAGHLMFISEMRFIEPINPSEATGLVAQVYEEVEQDLQPLAVLRDSPFLAQSPSAEVLAAFWSVLYETVLVEGMISRADKEAIAASVSKSNDCPFCLQVHAGQVDIAGDRAGDRSDVELMMNGSDLVLLLNGLNEQITDAGRRELAEWAAATRDPSSETVRKPPFTPEQAPEAIGTAVAFHYVNRVVNVFMGHAGLNIGPTPLPELARLTRNALERERKPGRSRRLLADAELPEDLGWAASSPEIAGAFARLVASAEAAGEAVLDEAERACVAAAIEAWDGSDPPLGSEWIDEALNGLDRRSSRARARLALLAALAPHRIDDAAVEAFKRERPHDRELVGAVAWSASRVARRIGSWLEAKEPVSEAV